MTLTIETTPLAEQHETNLRALDAHIRSEVLRAWEGRIEGDQAGNAILMPFPAPEHGIKRVEVAFSLETLLGPTTITECGVSTTLGYRGPDVVWCSPERYRRAYQATPEGKSALLLEAPEICVEIVSPSNRKGDLNLRKALFFEAGAEEVWLCQETGAMQFYHKSTPDHPAASSPRCPGFPARIEA